MKKSRFLASAIGAVVILACLANVVLGQTSEGSLANVTGGGSSAKWDVTAANSGGTLTINFPDGRSIRKTFRAGGSPSIMIGDKYFDSPPDGVYSYELQLASAPSEAAIKARGKDDDPESERAGRKRVSVPMMTQSGSFAVLNGSIVLASGVEQSRRDAKASVKSAPRATASANMLQRIRNNHRAFFVPDQVIPDDLIVQGSTCVGLDCVNNEGFNFDTIRLKENNTRILFLDTSSQAGFPTNDWIIKANDSGGGSSYLGIVDHGNAGTGAETGTIIAQFDAGASANSLRVSNVGRVGLKTATPVLALHINEGDTPDIRLEQNAGGGFGAQTWDIAGNEANFFVRDVTSGSRLPFRIRPGAPTSSLDISADGDVGIGTGSPSGRLHATSAGTSGTSIFLQNTDAGGKNWRILSTGTTNTGGAGILGLVNHTDDSANYKFMITPAGNVGIATSAPTQTLSVNGTAGKTGGGTWDVFSDQRLKNIKGNFNTGLKAVMRLQPLRYEYKPDNALKLKSEGQHIGFSAQTLQEIIPEAVTRSSDGYLMVKSDPILWTMLNAIKEQQQQIAELKAEVRKLQTAARKRKR